MTREKAIKIVKEFINGTCLHLVDQEALETLIPELREREDERIRKALVWHLKAGEDFVSNGVRKEECIAYLEKQKENPKSADSIPSDCVSDAKFEDRWYKVTNSTPADGRTVLAKDNIGNYLLASFAGGEWFVERYDLDDVPIRHTWVVEWCEIPSEKQKEPVVNKEGLYYYLGGKFVYCGYPATEENPYDFAMSQQEKQKEQKPVDYEAELKKCKDNPLYFYDKYVSIKQKPTEWSEKDETSIAVKNPEAYKIGFADGEAYAKEQAEWSEEDKNGMFSDIIMAIRAFYKCEREDLVDYVKSLRPSWKPTEEQMESLRRAVDKLAKIDVVASVSLSIMYDNLKKLM